ncbi:hypothetical protein BH23ACT9_BH23ACT9_19330 [soil metagenome]
MRVEYTAALDRLMIVEDQPAFNVIDLDQAGRPAFMAVITATGTYAYRRPEGVDIIPLTTLAP